MTPDLTSAQDRWRVDPAVSLLQVAGRAALFHEGQQKVFELNELAWRIWRGVAAGDSCGEVAAGLSGIVGSRDVALGYVLEMTRTWLREGCIRPQPVEALLTVAGQAHRRLSIAGLGFTVDIHGDPPPGLLEMLQPLEGEAETAAVLVLAPWRSAWLLYIEGRAQGLAEGARVVPAVKSALVDRVCALLTTGFVTHGALIERSGRRLFLSGAPKAGKSTLAVALSAAGFTCLADDIVHVDPDALFQGAPFAPGLKTGAWPLLETMVSLGDLPVHLRKDAQEVKYLPAVVTRAGTAPITDYIALDRREEGAAVLHQLSPLDAMTSLLAGSVSPARSIDGPSIANLAARFDQVRCHTLAYSDLQDAVQRLRALTDG